MYFSYKGNDYRHCHTVTFIPKQFLLDHRWLLSSLSTNNLFFIAHISTAQCILYHTSYTKWFDPIERMNRETSLNYLTLTQVHLANITFDTNRYIIIWISRWNRITRSAPSAIIARSLLFKSRFFSAIIAIKMYKQRVHIVRKIVEDAATFNSHTIALSVVFYAQTAKTLSDKSRSYCARLSCILKSNHK